MTNPSLVFLRCNHYIVLSPRGRKVSREQHYFVSIILLILIQIILLLLLHVLFDLFSVKFFLYLRPAREEGASSLAGVAMFKVVVYMCLYFGFCMSRVVVVVVSVMNISSSILVFCMLLHLVVTDPLEKCLYSCTIDWILSTHADDLSFSYHTTAVVLLR